MVQLKADSKLFFYARDIFKEKLDEERRKESPDQDVLDDVTSVLEYIMEDRAADIATFDQLTAQGEMTFQFLWSMFPPNCIAYHYQPQTEQDQLFIVRSVEYIWKNGREILIFYCALVTDDGNSFGFATEERIFIESFKGSRKIQNLPIFPLEYHIDKTRIWENAIQRGRRFAKMVGHYYGEMSGPAMKEVRNPDGKVRYTNFRVSDQRNVWILDY